jgi:type III restriction enzyme
LRAANARILIEQSIGRGLRLPYGKRTGVMTVDRLNIVAHDKFQEIIDEANKPGSTIRLQHVVLSDEQLGEKTVTVVSQSQLVIQQTMDIPRILVVPTGVVQSGFRPFSLKLGSLNYQPPSDELWIQHLRTHEREVLTLGKGGIEESRMGDYVVSGLVDYDDVSYDDHADLLYDLAGQVVNHLQGYLSTEVSVRLGT